MELDWEVVKDTPNLSVYHATTEDGQISFYLTESNIVASKVKIDLRAYQRGGHSSINMVNEHVPDEDAEDRINHLKENALNILAMKGL